MTYGRDHRRWYHLPRDKERNDLNRYIEIELNKRSPLLRKQQEMDYFIQNLYAKQGESRTNKASPSPDRMVKKSPRARGKISLTSLGLSKSPEPSMKKLEPLLDSTIKETESEKKEDVEVKRGSECFEEQGPSPVEFEWPRSNSLEKTSNGECLANRKE